MDSEPRNDLGKIFIGGLSRDTTYEQFNAHFEEYGEIIDSVIMKDRNTCKPRRFGFVTYADSSVVDSIIEDTHIIDGKMVDIKRTIPKGSEQLKDCRTKKIFVGGIPPTVTEDELKDFFSKHGNVVEHQIIYDQVTNRSRGFGFLIFDSEEVVDELLSHGNMIDMAGSKVEINKSESKKYSNPPPGHAFSGNSSGHSYRDSYSGFGGPYDSYNGGYGPGSFTGGPGSSTGAPYGCYASGYGYPWDYMNGYGIGYPSPFAIYDAGFAANFISGFGGYGCGGEGYGIYGHTGYGGDYVSGNSSGYNVPGGLYGSGGNSSSGRYHPYAR